MARDATDTREVLLRTARRMFASDGIYQVPLKRIIETAGQRNASALHYHFGGRDGLLVAITERHDVAIELERAAMLDRLEAEGRLDDVRSLVEALVVPFAHELTTDEGREYLRIVEQLVGLFDLWDIEVATGPTGAQRVFLPHRAAARRPGARGPSRAHHAVPLDGHRGARDAGAASRRRPSCPRSTTTRSCATSSTCASARCSRRLRRRHGACFAVGHGAASRRPPGTEPAPR